MLLFFIISSWSFWCSSAPDILVVFTISDSIKPEPESLDFLCPFLGFTGLSKNWFDSMFALKEGVIFSWFPKEIFLPNESLVIFGSSPTQLACF